MTGNEIITITIDNGEKRLSTPYSILNADNFLDKQRKLSIMKI